MYALRLARSIGADAGKTLAAVGALAAQIHSKFPRRTAAREFAGCRGWHLLSTPHRLPVESFATAVRRPQHRASLLSRVGATRHRSPVLETLPEGLPPATGHCLALAVARWHDDQGSLGWGKKPAKTRPIAVSWGSSVRC